MTTITMLRNEMSTVLLLLEYRDISKMLAYLDDDKPRARMTHIAILNHTLDKYMQGTLCIPLRRPRRPEMDSCLRL
jgi:hypothetical protein